MKRVIGQKDFFLAIVLASILLALLLAMGCAGGPRQESTGQYVDDTVITSKVKSQLFRDPDVSGFQVKVETYKGRVQLSGFVDTPEQQAKAAEVARGVAGVESVTNSVIVKAQ